MTLFEKAKATIQAKEIAYEEAYHGIGFLVSIEAITHIEYTQLMNELEKANLERSIT